MMHGDVVVRLAGINDVDAIIALERTTAEAPHWPWKAYERMIAEAAEPTAPRLLVVAIGDNELLGFAVGRIVADVGELESVAVAENARRRGIGRSLCVHVIGWCRERGAAVVELEVRQASAGARALYRGLGFVEEGTRRGYYQNPVDDAVLMRMGVGAS